MTFTKVSAWSGKVHTLDLNVTQAQVNMWRNGMVIQCAMPQLQAWEREFLITGMTQEEWDEMSAQSKEA